MADVFISYSRSNSGFVHWLHDELTSDGTSVWVDWVDIPPASEWEKDIYENIDAADSVVFVISAASLESQYCGKELQRAIKGGKRLVPIACDDADPAKATPELAQLNWIWCRNEQERPEALAKLKSALSTDLEWARTHTRLLVRAVEWKSRDEDKSLLLRGRDLGDAEGALAANVAKQPTPTELHHHYVAASRKTASRRQRAFVAFVLVALLLSVALGALAQIQRSAAVAAQHRAQQATVIARRDARLALQRKQEADRSAARAKAAAARAKASAERALRAELAAQASNSARLSLLLGSVTQEQVGSHLDLALIAGLRANELGTSSSVTVPMIAAQEKAHAAGITGFLEGDASQVNTLAFNGSGSEVAAANANGSVDVWNTETNHRVVTLRSTGSSAVLATFSPDGEWLAVGYGDGSVLLWNLERGTFERLRSATSVYGEPEPATSLAFSDSGRYFAFGSRASTVPVYSLGSTFRLAYRFTDPYVSTPEDCLGWSDPFPITPSALSVAFLGGGADPKLVVGDSYLNPGWGNVITWRLGAPRRDYTSLVINQGDTYVPTAPTTLNPIQVLSPNGRYLAVFVFGEVQVFRTQPTSSPVASCTAAPTVLKIPLRGSAATTASIAFSPNGPFIAVGGSDGSISQWSLVRHARVSTTRNLFQDDVEALAYNSSGRQLVASDKLGILKLTTAAEGTFATATSIDRGAIGKGSFGEGFSGNDRVVGTANPSSSRARLWSLASGDPSPIGSEVTHSGCSSIAFDRTGGQFVLNCDEGGRLDYYSHRGSAPVSLVDPYGDEYFNEFALSPNGQYVAVGLDGYEACSVELWNTHKGPHTAQSLNPTWPFLDCYSGPNMPASCGFFQYGTFSVAFSPNSQQVAVAYGFGGVQLYSTLTGKPEATLLSGQLSSIGECTKTPNLQVLAFSPNGHVLAISYDNGVTLLWNTRTGAEVAVQSPLTSPITTLAFSPDGKFLAVGGTDGSVALVEASSGLEIGQPFVESHGDVNALSFSADGHSLYAAYTDGTVVAFDDIIWPNIAWLRQQVCQMVSDPISRTLWATYGSGTPYVNACS